MTIWFISIWGIIGAVIATAIATVLGQIIIMNIYYTRVLHIDIKYLYIQSMVNIVPFQLIAAIFGFFIGLCIKNKYLSFLVSGLLYVVISSILLYFFGVNNQEKEMLKKLIRKIRR